MDLKGGAVKWLRVLELRIIKVMQSFLSDIELHTQVYSCQHLQAHCTARISSKPSFNDFILLQGTQNLLTKFAYIFLHIYTVKSLLSLYKSDYKIFNKLWQNKMQHSTVSSLVKSLSWNFQLFHWIMLEMEALCC